MATSWSRNALTEYGKWAREERKGSAWEAVDEAYLPIIARLVEAVNEIECVMCDGVVAWSLLTKENMTLMEAKARKAIESISPADMAAIEEWKATK